MLFFIHDTFCLGEDYEVSRISERSRRRWKTKVKRAGKLYRDVLNESSNDLEVRVAATLQIRKKIKRLQSLR